MVKIRSQEPIYGPKKSLFPLPPLFTKPTFTLVELDDGIQLDFKHFTVVIRSKKNN